MVPLAQYALPCTPSRPLNLTECIELARVHTILRGLALWLQANWRVRNKAKKATKWTVVVEHCVLWGSLIPLTLLAQWTATGCRDLSTSFSWKMARGDAGHWAEALCGSSGERSLQTLRGTDVSVPGWATTKLDGVAGSRLPWRE